MGDFTRGGEGNMEVGAVEEVEAVGGDGAMSKATLATVTGVFNSYFNL